VAVTLLEAIALVFLVMFLFLQNWRYTVIPTIVVPVACWAPSPRCWPWASRSTC
jgi:multidrug efflux pump subunit AcrB